MVREELRLVRRHVNVQRTVTLAALARETQVERLVDALVGPAARDRIALHHLEQHPRAAARRVLLLARHAIARAHRAVLLAPALTHPEAAECRVCEAPVGPVVEERRDHGWVIARTEAQVLVDAI